MNHLNKSVLCLGLLAGMLTVGADSIATTSSSLAIGSCQHAAYAGGVIEFGFIPARLRTPTWTVARTTK